MGCCRIRSNDPRSDARLSRSCARGVTRSNATTSTRYESALSANAAIGRRSERDRPPRRSTAERAGQVVIELTAAQAPASHVNATRRRAGRSAPASNAPRSAGHAEQEREPDHDGRGRSAHASSREHGGEPGRDSCGLTREAATIDADRRSPGPAHRREDERASELAYEVEDAEQKRLRTGVRR